MNHMTPESQSWPMPGYQPDVQPHFLFILTPPYAGSTALAELINSSPRTMFLEPRAEGQWLVPGMCTPGRWDAQHPMNYASIRAVWLQRYQWVRALVGRSVDVVVEKSPPNMLRMTALMALFERVSLLASNRDPYANCASILYRNHPAETLSEAQRLDVLRGLAQSWLFRSQQIQAVLQRHAAVLITHEQFCADPGFWVQKIPLPAEVVQSINPHALLKVKDYPEAPLQCFNAEQTARLKPAEIACISQVLAEHADLLAYYGYALR
jgi:hypothetical protein